jgi:hypothetical protein
LFVSFYSDVKRQSHLHLFTMLTKSAVVVLILAVASCPIWAEEEAADLQAESDSGSDVDPSTDENTAAEASAEVVGDTLFLREQF